MKKLTKREFAATKRALIVLSPKRVARRHDRSVKTILQVKGSKTYADYQAQNKAQHPPVQFSLRDSVMEMHRIIFDKEDYVAPRSAQRAITELLEASREAMGDEGNE